MSPRGSYANHAPRQTDRAPEKDLEFGLLKAVYEAPGVEELQHDFYLDRGVASPRHSGAFMGMSEVADALRFL